MGFFGGVGQGHVFRRRAETHPGNAQALGELRLAGKLMGEILVGGQLLGMELGRVG